MKLSVIEVRSLIYLAIIESLDELNNRALSTTASAHQSNCLLFFNVQRQSLKNLIIYGWCDSVCLTRESRRVFFTGTVSGVNIINLCCKLITLNTCIVSH